MACRHVAWPIGSLMMHLRASIAPFRARPIRLAFPTPSHHHQRALHLLYRPCLQTLYRPCHNDLSLIFRNCKLRGINSPLSRYAIQPKRRLTYPSSPSSPSSRLYSTRPNPDPTPHLGSPEPALSLTQRLRVLSREYGWSALGVYLLLTALDFPLCYLGVRWLGSERIGHWEHAIVEAFWTVVHIPFPNLERGGKVVAGHEGAPDQPIPAAVEQPSNADEEEEGASIWTELALAYAVHKSLIVFRVPLTAAVTPKVVKTLRSWGWDIGKRKPKAV